MVPKLMPGKGRELGGALLAAGLACLATGVAAQSRPAAPAGAERPNIVVIFTDDQGYADLGAQGVLPDIRTPNIDRLAAEGMLCESGYVTAPQCTPSRAGLMTGRYQTRFGVEHIAKGPLPLGEVTLADRLRAAGYATAQVGKWHLEPNHTNLDWAAGHVPGFEGGSVVHLTFQDVRPYMADRRGFGFVFQGELNTYWTTHGLDGAPMPGGEPASIDVQGYRIDLQTEAALRFLGTQDGDDPFFLYLAYMAPHVPLVATEEYLARFPDPDLHPRRRHCLAMMSAIDDGVGRLRAELEEMGEFDDTLFFFASDNGAPLLAHTRDYPVDRPGGAWDGSLNDPLAGEKGMLTEGGIRVPFLVTWPGGKLRSGEVFDAPVSTLDIVPTAMAVAGIAPGPDDALDGVNILPALRGEAPLDERPLFWRFWNQTAIRRGDWKLVALSDGRRLLHDLSSPESEGLNRLAERPELARALEQELTTWASQLSPPGMPTQPLNGQEQVWYSEFRPAAELGQ